MLAEQNMILILSSQLVNCDLYLLILNISGHILNTLRIYMIDDFWVSKEASGPLPILVKDLCFDPKRYCLNYFPHPYSSK